MNLLTTGEEKISMDGSKMWLLFWRGRLVGHLKETRKIAGTWVVPVFKIAVCRFEKSFESREEALAEAESICKGEFE